MPAVIFLILSVVFLFFYYALYFRGLLLERKIIELFGKDKCVEYPYKEIFTPSPYMRREGGTVSLLVHAKPNTDLVMFRFTVNNQLNMFRFLVKVIKVGGIQDGLYGRDHIYGQCKYYKLYSNFYSLGDAKNVVSPLTSDIEAIEIFEGNAFIYYRLNGFIGYEPITSIYEELNRG